MGVQIEVVPSAALEVAVEVVEVNIGGSFAGGGGAVDSVNGHTGTVVLTATDVGADPAGTAASAVSEAGYSRSFLLGGI